MLSHTTVIWHVMHYVGTGWCRWKNPCLLCLQPKKSPIPENEPTPYFFSFFFIIIYFLIIIFFKVLLRKIQTAHLPLPKRPALALDTVDLLLLASLSLLLFFLNAGILWSREAAEGAWLTDFTAGCFGQTPWAPRQQCTITPLGAQR